MSSPTEWQHCAGFWCSEKALLLMRVLLVATLVCGLLALLVGAGVI